MAARRGPIRRVLRILGRIALVVAALVVVAIVAAVIALHTDWGRNKIRRAAVDAMAKVFPCGVSIGAVEGDVLGDAVVRDVELRGCDQRPAIKVDRIELNLKLTALVGGTIRLEYLRAHGVTIDAHKPDDGPLNLLAMFRPSPEPFGWDVELPEVEVDGVAVALDLGGRAAHLDDLAIHGRVAVPTNGGPAAGIVLTGRWRERDVAVSATADLKLVDGAISIPHLTASVAESASSGAPLVAVDGTDLRFAGTSDVRGRLRIEVAAGAITRLVPWLPPTPAGVVTLAVSPAGDHQLAMTVDGTAGPAALAGWIAMTTTSPLRFSGVVRATGTDVHAFVPTAIPTDLDAAIVFGLELVPTAPIPLGGLALVIARGTIDGRTVDSFAAHAVLEPDTISAFVHATAPGDAEARIRGDLVIGTDGTIAIEHGGVVGRVGAIEAVVPELGLTGGADVDVTVATTLTAAPVITVAGRITGRHLRRGSVRAALAVVDLRTVRVDVGAPARPHGSATVVVTGGAIAGQAVPTVTVTAISRTTGGYDVTASTAGNHLTAAGAPWSIDLTAVARPAPGFGSVAIDLGHYAIRVDHVPWTGTGGRLEVSRRQLAIAGVRASLEQGDISVDGALGFGGGPLDATVRLDGVSLALADRALGLTARGLGPLRGTAGLSIELHRRRGQAWSGSVAGTVTGFAVRPDVVSFFLFLSLSLVFSTWWPNACC